MKNIILILMVILIPFTIFSQNDGIVNPQRWVGSGIWLNQPPVTYVPTKGLFNIDIVNNKFYIHKGAGVHEELVYDGNGVYSGGGSVSGSTFINGTGDVFWNNTGSYSIIPIGSVNISSAGTPSPVTITSTGDTYVGSSDGNTLLLGRESNTVGETILIGDNNNDVIKFPGLDFTGVSNGDALVVANIADGTIGLAPLTGGGVHSLLNDGTGVKMDASLGDAGAGTPNSLGALALDIQLDRNGATEVATGANSIAIGSYNKATMFASTALGYDNDALGNNSIAIGRETLTNGTNSIAIGREVSAYSFGEAAIGAYSEFYSPVSSIAHNIQDKAFVVGAGASNAATNNAFTVYKSGAIGLDLVADNTLTSIPNPSEGMVIYNNTSNALEFHDGTDWSGMGYSVFDNLDGSTATDSSTNIKYDNGYVQFGTPTLISPYYFYQNDVGQLATDFGGNVYLNRSNLELDYTSDLIGVRRGALLGSVSVKNGNTVNYNQLVGSYGLFHHYGTGTVSSGIGGLFIAKNDDLGTVSEMSAILASTEVVTTGTVTNGYGLKLQVNDVNDAISEYRAISFASAFVPTNSYFIASEKDIPSFMDGGISLGNRTLGDLRLKIQAKTGFDPIQVIGMKVDNTATNMIVSDGSGTWKTREFSTLPGAVAPDGRIIYGTGTSYASDVSFNWDETNNRLGLLNSSPESTVHIGDGGSGTGELRMHMQAASAENSIISFERGGTGANYFEMIGYGTASGTLEEVAFITNDVTPVENMRFKPDGSTTINELKVNGDIYSDQIGSGLILKSPNNSCWRITVSDAGVLSTSNIGCPL